VKKIFAGLLVSGALMAMPFDSTAQGPAPGPDMILTRSTTKTTDEVVEAIKSYSEAKKWLYMGASKVKQGEVTLVKVCLPEVGKALWPVGLQLSALLPCGNLGIYDRKDRVEISMLHPHYMQLLYPHPAVDKAVAMATPLLTEMLEAVAK
jgi:hypothetical protein